MRHVPSGELVTLDPAALERFTTELIAAGFEPVPGTGRRIWEGPLAEPFVGLTLATTMRLRFRDGWPFRHPYILVDGLTAEHTNAEGVVCLWREDDNSRVWMGLDGIYSRIADWCEKARAGFGLADLALDAHLGFDTQDRVLVTVDLHALRPAGFADGLSGGFYGIEKHPRHIELHHGSGPTGSLKGQWYYRDRVPVPPRNLDEFRESLARGQRRNFERGLERYSRGNHNGLRLAALFWLRHGHLDALVLRIDSSGNGVKAKALWVAPNDDETLLRRAGPDAPHLREKRVVLFGCGAIGSHTGLLLAESGIGNLHLVDNDLLRPGNVVRHVAGPQYVGMPKSEVVKDIAQRHAPWSEIQATIEAPFGPDGVAALLADADLAIDATGHAPFIEVVSRVAEREPVLLVSVALYRAAAVGRVRRQLPGLDTPIYLRGNDSHYPVIPPGDDDNAGYEIGCSAPINNAPPSAVAAVSALALQVSVDTLLGCQEHPDEIIDVYRLLDQPPFNRLGRVHLDIHNA